MRRKIERIMVVLLVIGFVVGALTAGALAAPRTAQWVCPADGSCHVLLEEGAEIYLLTADGHVLIEINGDDSVRVENIPD